MSQQHVSSKDLRVLVEREPVPEAWERLLVGGLNNISCQDLEVMMTNLLQKHCEWQEKRDPMKNMEAWYGRRCFLPAWTSRLSYAKPKHVANIMDRHGFHGWLISSVLRETRLQGSATFEQVDTSFTFNRCLRQESIEALKLWQMMAMQLLSEIEKRWKERRMGILLDFEDEEADQICSMMWADNFWVVSHSKKILEEMLQDIIEEAKRWDLLPKAASL